MKNLPTLETRTIALLMAMAVGFGIAVHPFFFIVALLFVLLAAMEWTFEKFHEYQRSFRKTYRRA